MTRRHATLMEPLGYVGQIKKFTELLDYVHRRLKTEGQVVSLCTIQRQGWSEFATQTNGGFMLMQQITGKYTFRQQRASRNAH